MVRYLPRHWAPLKSKWLRPLILCGQHSLAIFCLSVFLVTGIAALAERRRIDSYGLPIEQAFGKFFWKGMLAGLLVVLFVAGAMILSGAMVLHGTGDDGVCTRWPI